MRKIKLIKWGLIAGFSLTVLALGFIKTAMWFDDHQFIFQSPVQITFNKPVQIVRRELLKPTVIEIANELPELKDLTPIEKYICDKWGAWECRVALAVFTQESGMNCQAWNVNAGGSFDSGVAQINSSWFDETFTPADAFDCYKNVDKAYEIWDRGDGKVGDDKGNFNAWVVWKTGAFKNSL